MNISCIDYNSYIYISNNGKFKEGIIWWDSEIDLNADVDIYFYIHDYQKCAEQRYGFKTLEIDIKNKSTEEIFS
ncbi:hypothetical protein [Candidatus Mycoplasma mahonii]|uniref:hypothetical protein n=1 Tax=Candidatus Mycoplasma mahonii TaxID=3004105 RepID=UPI0026EFAD90|nr:hypothetical protein [Candidatus Mycoplasma mahonii]WKX02594.1 hypothetical protein O3I44_00750 [Candidatus Mycoplasma mahonii]